MTLDFSRLNITKIFQQIFVERGGAPVQFLVEHVTLAWPNGLAGLRLPCLLFFLLALAWAGQVARDLVGDAEAVALPFLLALAPLAVGLATFARMYALFLWLVLVAAWLAIRAGRSGESIDWVLAGTLAGALVYVHPIAPLYSVTALGCGLASTELPLRQLWRRARPGIAAAVLIAVPYAYALAVLRARYDVGAAGRLSTTAGRSVPEESLHAFTVGSTSGLVALSLLAGAGAVQLGRERPRVAAVLTLWVALPVAFFALVPADTRFFGRYLLPALPAFLLLVATGARVVGRRSAIVALIVAVAVAAEGSDDLNRLRRLHDLQLSSLPHPAPDEVLFSSTGTPGSAGSGRPPELLDDLVALESPRALRVEELPAIDPRYEADLVQKGTRNVREFLAISGDARGLWLFRGQPQRVAAAARRLADDPDLALTRIGDEFLVVSSRRREPRRRLIELGVRARENWGLTTPADRWPRVIAAVDRAALAYRGTRP